MTVGRKYRVAENEERGLERGREILQNGQRRDLHPGG